MRISTVADVRPGLSELAYLANVSALIDTLAQ
jgi:hypothetical protein